MTGNRRDWTRTRIEPRFWQTRAIHLPVGQHAYKFLLDGQRWLDDPGNSSKTHDGIGGLNSKFVVPIRS